MREPFDRDLSRALKAGAGGELSGWEFTPALQQKVLGRIRAEEAGGTAPDRPRRSLALPRPLMWAAVAAAVLMIAVNIDVSGLGGRKKAEMPAERPVAAQSAGQAPPTPTAAAKMAAPASIAPAKADFSVSAPEARIAPPSPPAAEPRGGRTVQLHLPAETAGGRAKDAAPPSLAVRPVSNPAFRVVAAGSQAVVFRSSGAVALDRTGAQAWERAVPGVTAQTVLAASPDGRVAVGTGRELRVIGSGGQVQQTADLPAEVTGIAWGGDGSLAVLCGDVTAVYRDGALRFQVKGVPTMDGAFGPDGSLALLALAGEDRRLILLDKDGNQTLTTTLRARGKGLIFGADGAVIAAAGYGIDRSGTMLWRMPFPTEGMLSLGGSSTVAGWDAHAAVAVRLRDGTEVWRASWDGSGGGIRKVVASADGRLVALVAATPDGGVVWVLDQNGALRHAERLGPDPADVAFAGNRLILLMPEGIISREISL